MRTKSSRGFTLIELLIVVAIIGIIAAIAVPGLIRARLAGNEASAISTVRSISSANVAYYVACGGYAIAMPPLLANGFLPEPLGGVPAVKSGYAFRIVPGTGAISAGSGVGMCAGAQSAFFTTAVPLGASSGIRTFALREPGVIYQDLAGNPIADPPVIGGTVSAIQ